MDTQRQSGDSHRFIQLSGHTDSFVPSEYHTVLKKVTTVEDETTPYGTKFSELSAYRLIMKDSKLKRFTPTLKGYKVHGETYFVELEDLTHTFDIAKRTLVDIKIGRRTYTRIEASSNKKRRDMYTKAVNMAPQSLSVEDHTDKAITKAKYLKLRDDCSTSTNLGFRLEASRLPGMEVRKGYDLMSARRDVEQVLLHHVGQPHIRVQLCERLREMREVIQTSAFFKENEVIGTSLLLVHDGIRSGIWIIDFANVLHVKNTPENIKENFAADYLAGIDSLIEVSVNSSIICFYYIKSQFQILDSTTQV
ncbi:inositol polyphosphate kinase domain-containing protein [Ditylenchus destructor]|nr:inositol polyphosphate kinase domain-containing protein [Ditylenchus destructor]